MVIGYGPVVFYATWTASKRISTGISASGVSGRGIITEHVHTLGKIRRKHVQALIVEQFLTVPDLLRKDDDESVSPPPLSEDHLLLT
jgi:hypothetical protein